jgi:SAM-dependent methyltransferase
MNLAHINFSGKTVLEVGCGRGDTTRQLVNAMAGQPGAVLIVTDISDAYFPQLKVEFCQRDLQIRFFQEDACRLESIPSGSVDYLVCNYTLCAINGYAGRLSLALRRFWEVLAPGGQLSVEEEFPIHQADTPTRAVWAGKWRVLKAAITLTGGTPYQEMAPDDLQALCSQVGFVEIVWSHGTSYFSGGSALDFFRKRLDGLLPRLPNDNLRAGFSQLAGILQEQATRAGGMETPYYQLVARKGLSTL